MLKIITSLTMFVGGLLAANAQVSETRTVAAFTKIEITDGVELIYTQGDQTALSVETSDGLGLSSLDTDTVNGTLQISCKGNGCEPAKVFVTAPKLVSVKASRDSKVTFTKPLYTTEFTALLASRATFNGIVKAQGHTVLKGKSGAVFNIRVESFSLKGDFRKDSKVNLSGICSQATLYTDGNALCHAKNFAVDTLMVNAASTSTVWVNAADDTSVAVSDQAKVSYFGEPEKVTYNPGAIARKENSCDAVALEN